MKTSLLLVGLVMATIACRAAQQKHEVSPPFAGPVPAPLILEGKAYDRAGVLELPATEAAKYPGVHNVFFLSDSIISGSEPEGEAGLESLAELGVKTIVSVDGKAPAAEAAARLGMRYVHVPIQYKGINPEQMAQLAKTFRELEAPFYVHCFHGKHRGPAGAAVGRVVHDGAERDVAIAEMRQYAGTSKKYEGLYRSIAGRAIPAADSTETFAFDFAPVHVPAGIVGVMVTAARTHDNLLASMENAWAPDPEHPDIDPRNEAQKLAEAFAAGVDMSEVTESPADLQGWWSDTAREAEALARSLELGYTGLGSAMVEADQHFEAIRDLCSSCHAGYRNED